jgi:saxitoxin biosynthesis operon SxtJ-like protein
VALLRALWQAWKTVAARIGHFQSRLILVVLYFVVVGPLALVMRVAGDPLGIKGTAPAWTERRRTISLETARRQF